MTGLLNPIKFYPLWCALTFLVSIGAEGREQQFSDFEKQVFNLIMSKEKEAEQVWQGLTQLHRLPQSSVPGNQALLLLKQCLVAAWSDSAKITELKPKLQALREQQAYQNGSAAEFACLGYEETAAGSQEAFSFDYQAYHQLDAIDMPLLKMWISYDYAKSAMDYGYLDEAMEAITLSMEIAQQNQLTEWQGESLGVLALVQSEMELYEQALQNNSKALVLVAQPYQLFELGLNRGFILIRAGKLNEAAAHYQQLLEQSGEDRQRFLIIGSNLSDIYFQQGKHTDNLALTEKLIAEAEQQEDRHLSAYANMTRAFALFLNGEKQEALQRFATAKNLFEQNNLLTPLADNLASWANLLSEAGDFQLAYIALAESKALKVQIEEKRRLNDALLQNAMLDTEQQKRALLKSQQAHERDLILLTQKQLEQKLWLTMIIAVLLVGTAVLYAYFRLRKAHRQMAIKNQQLDYESSHDPLTKVNNRRYFSQFIETKLAIGGNALILLMDIDYFKKVNDTYGHHAGDQVLQVVSKRLASRLRDNDCLVRWGGEEFLLFIDNPSDISNSQSLVTRLLAEVEGSPIKLADLELKVTISIGFTHVTLSSQAELEQHLAQIDSYLYQAKNQGRNRAVGQLTISPSPQQPEVLQCAK